MTKKLAKTRSSFLKGVLQDLEGAASGKSQEVTDNRGYRALWEVGYQQALDDVWERMEK